MKSMRMILGIILFLQATCSYAEDIMKRQSLIATIDGLQISQIVIQEKPGINRKARLLRKEISSPMVVAEIISGINNYVDDGKYDLYCSYEVHFIRNKNIVYAFEMFVDKTQNFIVLRDMTGKDRHDFVIDNNAAKIVVKLLFKEEVLVPHKKGTKVLVPLDLPE